MFQSGNRENGIIRQHERALRLVYDDSKNLPFRDVLLKDKSISTHQKIFHFKAKNGMAPEITVDLFCFVDKPYNLDYNTDCLKNETSLMIFKKCQKLDYRQMSMSTLQKIYRTPRIHLKLFC